MRTKQEIQCDAHITAAFLQGFACCLAQMLYLEGCATSATNELFGAGIGELDAMKRRIIDPYDLEIIEKHYYNDGRQKSKYSD